MRYKIGRITEQLDTGDKVTTREELQRTKRWQTEKLGTGYKVMIREELQRTKRWQTLFAQIT